MNLCVTQISEELTSDGKLLELLTKHCNAKLLLNNVKHPGVLAEMFKYTIKMLKYEKGDGNTADAVISNCLILMQNTASIKNKKAPIAEHSLVSSVNCELIGSYLDRRWHMKSSRIIHSIHTKIVSCIAKPQYSTPKKVPAMIFFFMQILLALMSLFSAADRQFDLIQTPELSNDIVSNIEIWYNSFVTANNSMLQQSIDYCIISVSIVILAICFMKLVWKILSNIAIKYNERSILKEVFNKAANSMNEMELYSDER